MNCRLIFASLLVVFFYSPILVDSQAWWSLGVSSCAAGSSSTCETCAILQSQNILTPDQKEKCASDSSPIQAIAKGTRQAIIECQDRFECRKWNCSTFQGDNLFGSFVVDLYTRETAVLYAFLAAGATKAVAEACHNQRIKDCPCTGNIGTVKDEDNNVIITSCSDNVPWAINFIEDFLGPSSSMPNATEEQLVVLCDEHNINVGTQAVKLQEQEERFCTCHGLSGSCSVQTCYKKAPGVSDVGESLYIKYDGAVKVKLVEGVLQRADNPQADPPSAEDLVYINDSPDFCTPDEPKGILGTQDRECDPSPNSAKSCQVLCCGRGYYTITYIVPVEECVFEYCCRIVCTNIRNDTVTEYRCK